MLDGRYENECHTEFDEKCETRYEEKCETKYETVNEQVDPHWHFHYLEKTLNRPSSCVSPLSPCTSVILVIYMYRVFF